LNKSGSWKLLNGLIGSGAKRDDVFCFDKVRLNVNQIFAPRIRGKRSFLLFFGEQKKAGSFMKLYMKRISKNTAAMDVRDNVQSVIITK